MTYDPFRIHTETQRAEKKAEARARQTEAPYDNPFTEAEAEENRSKTPEEIDAEVVDWFDHLPPEMFRKRHRVAHPYLKIGDLLTFSSISFLLSDGKTLADAERALRLRQRSASALVSRIERILDIELVITKTSILTPHGRTLGMMGNIWGHWYSLVMDKSADHDALRHLLSAEFSRILKTPEAQQKMAQSAEERLGRTTAGD